MGIVQPTSPKHPALMKQFEQRAADAQLRAADRITSFAGSMLFVYIHAVIFAVWIVSGQLTGFDAFPFGFLTLIVSLEAIFLSTFVMIGQNRQAAFAQAKADHDFTEQEQELKLNTELTKLIHQLTVQLHEAVFPDPNAPNAPTAND
jgi:uncharacterized membrane protein